MVRSSETFEVWNRYKDLEHKGSVTDQTHSSKKHPSGIPKGGDRFLQARYRWRMDGTLALKHVLEDSPVLHHPGSHVRFLAHETCP
ncbi:hypothetical protein BHE74_00055626 [Ensete ventricosum]|nr:hypothetical protein BHE74_00055626 [Ensete ventricosum]